MMFTQITYAAVGIGGCVLAMATGIDALRIEERQWYREVMGLMPFTDVAIHSTRVDGLSIEVTGQMKKARCDKVGHVAYTRSVHGPLVPAIFTAHGETSSTPANRPSSEFDQSFGPWVITSQIANPAYASFFVRHSCPEGMQSNMVFEVPWVSSSKTYAQSD